MDSQCKFGVLARGEASLYLRLSDRDQSIWDIAPGAMVVQEAGGQAWGDQGDHGDQGRLWWRGPIRTWREDDYKNQEDIDHARYNIYYLQKAGAGAGAHLLPWSSHQRGDFSTCRILRVR